MMKYALVNGERKESSPGLTGICQCCNSEVISKCGEVRIWHWAHKTNSECDRWWENETEWHRTWKGHFKKEWQEIVHFSVNNEKHIADIKTELGCVIEFQHSHIDPLEQRTRENFYNNMVWVVDGTRLKRDYPRFHEGMNNSKDLTKGHFLIHSPEQCFPKEWINSSKVVIFDFQGNLTPDPNEEVRSTLWCLLPGRAKGNAVVIATSRQSFIATAHIQATLIQANEIVSEIDKLLTQKEENRSGNSQNRVRRSVRQRL